MPCFVNILRLTDAEILKWTEKSETGTEATENQISQEPTVVVLPKGIELIVSYQSRNLTRRSETNYI